MSVYICEDCSKEDLRHAELEYVNVPFTDPQTCAGCSEYFVGEGNQVVQIHPSRELCDALAAAIRFCEKDGCGCSWDEASQEWAFKRTDRTLGDLLKQLAAELDTDEDVRNGIVAAIAEEGDLEIIGCPEPTCPNCQTPLCDWGLEIAVAPSEPVERLAQQLPPSQSTERAQFVGKVVELSGVPNPAAQLEGDVVLKVQAHDQLLKVRVTLGPKAYAQAGAAHLAQQYVSVHGRLHQGSLHHGSLTHGLENPTDFAIVPR